MKKNVIIIILLIIIFILTIILVDWYGRFRAMKVLLEQYANYYGISY